MACDGTTSGNFLDEWKEIRTMVGRYDGFLDGLRRYGFTFIALLLTASAVNEFIKLNIITRVELNTLIILFTLALYFFDIYYQELMKILKIRQMILETILNIEIGLSTEVRFKKEHLEIAIIALYIFFIIIEALFGYASSVATVAYANNTSATVNNSIATNVIDTNNIPILVFPNGFVLTNLLYFCILVGGGILIILIMTYWFKFLSIDLNPGKRALNDYKEDWFIDKLSCIQGDKVKITITNLGKKAIEFNKGGTINNPQEYTVCYIYSQGASRVIVDEIKTKYVCIPPDGNYSWFWNTSDFTEGVYDIQPRNLVSFIETFNICSREP